MDHFQLDPDLIYLNHAAVSPWPQRTVEAIQRFAAENGALGSSHYPRWIKTENRLREQLSRLVGTGTPEDIALLKNTSEGLSLVAHGLSWRAGDNIVISDQEFPSNSIVWESLTRYGVEVIKVDLGGAETPEAALQTAITPHTRLLSISSVQYGTGLRMDLEQIGHLCQTEGIHFCVDAIQSLGALQFDGAHIQPDFVVADGHKWMMAPEGCALFYTTPAVREQLQLHQFGWHMRESHLEFDAYSDQSHWQIAKSGRRFEPGSPNMLGIHGLEASLSLIEEVGINNIEQHVLERSRYLIDAISDHPQLRLITTPNSERQSGIVTFSATAGDNAGIQQQLSELGIQCALRAGGIRFSPHFYTPMAQLEQALNQITQLLNRR